MGTRVFRFFLVSCGIAAAMPLSAAQTVTLSFNGAPNGPLPWSEQGFTFTDGSGVFGGEEVVGGALRVSAFSGGFGFGSVIVARDDGGTFNARSLDVDTLSCLSLFGCDFSVGTSSTDPDWWYISGTGTEVFTGPEFEDITSLGIFVWPGSDGNALLVLDDLVVEVAGPENYCVTSPNSAGAGAEMDSAGSSSIAANTFTLVANGAPPSVAGLFVYGSNQVQVPFGNGFRCVGGDVQRLSVGVTDATGHAERTLDFNLPPVGSGPNAILPGSTWNFQFWYRDAAPLGAGFNLSDGLSVPFLP